MKQSQELSNFKSSDEDYFDSIFGFDTKIEELTREVREHNNFARKMPVIEEQIRVINHRIENLEKFYKSV